MKPTPPPLDADTERLARLLSADTSLDVRTIRRYLRGERVSRGSRVLIEAAYRRRKKAA
jgi:hypothetical protein